jgi:hypothetical protein
MTSVYQGLARCRSWVRGWSCHTYKPGSIWIMQIIKNLYTDVAWPWFFLCWCNVLRWIWCLWCYSECISTPGKLENMPGHGGNRTYDLASPLTVLELDYLADLWSCARCLVFKLHFFYFLNMRQSRIKKTAPFQQIAHAAFDCTVI